VLWPGFGQGRADADADVQGPAARMRPDRTPRRRTLSVGAGLLAHGSTP